ncbi:thioesterase [Amylibacter kogurei]|uniref:Thioesterase n=1 Tax=Paramylibacter kogurei TaxID=1889778 RepID=A0A2G5KAD2_9RHOB|nr:alpha/beta fold hydrolase [Amylibacter kogurei]PIB26491.1 thioesterase [Amylibacter kogurei]
MLHFQEFGEASDKPTLLIVHGLFGSGRNWRAIAKRLSADRRVITVDMRNHGDSFWDDSHTYFDMAEDLATVIQTLDSPVDIIGHSMGGKAAMLTALQHPKLVNKLIVVDIAPVTYDHSQISNVQVMQSIPLDQISRRSDADKFMADYISEDMVRAFLLQSLTIGETQNSWVLNLAALATNMNDIVGFPKIDAQFTPPCLFIRGALSAYILPQHHEALFHHFPNAKIHTIDGAGHWVHAEAQRAFIGVVSDYLKSNPQ